MLLRSVVSSGPLVPPQGSVRLQSHVHADDAISPPPPTLSSRALRQTSAAIAAAYHRSQAQLVARARCAAALQSHRCTWHVCLPPWRGHDPQMARAPHHVQLSTPQFCVCTVPSSGSEKRLRSWEHSTCGPGWSPGALRPLRQTNGGTCDGRWSASASSWRTPGTCDLCIKSRVQVPSL